MLSACYYSLLFLSLALAIIPDGTPTPPTCALNYPCPPPQWIPEYQLNLSTICQPGVPNYFLPLPNQPWGLVSLDWSTAELVWLNVNRNMSTMEKTATQNAKMIKSSSPRTKVFIYHNMELALQWIESQRAVMYDISKANWFLQYTDGNGHKNGTIYNDRRSEGDQFFWDFRVPEAADYFISSIIEVSSNPYVDGTFSDDVSGIPAEHPEIPIKCKLSPSEVADIQYSTQATSQRLIDTLIKHGKYNWQAFSRQDDVGPSPSKDSCLTFMREYCSVEKQKNPMTMGMRDESQEQTIAAFLITRPPFAWVGYGWESDNRQWKSIFNLDVGEPVGMCEEGPSGVFSRKWSEGVAQLDCNTFMATLPFKSY